MAQICRRFQNDLGGRSYRLGLRKRAIARMAMNAGLDLGIGVVALLGDVFDIAFKSNRRNIAILKKEVSRL